MKSQTVRLIDVFVLGPWMIYLSQKQNGLSKVQRDLLFLAGAGTIVYNGLNYLEIKRHGQKTNR